MSAPRADPVPLRVLILEDRATDAELLVHELRRHGFDPEWWRVETKQDYLAHLDHTLDLILADYAVPGFGALQALRLLRQRDLNVPFIIVSGTIDEETAVSAMREGASDYLLKDRLGRLGVTVARALDDRRLRAHRRRIEEDLRQSERNLAEAQRIAHIGSWEMDFATNGTRRSEEVDRTLGVEPGAFDGSYEAFLAFVHPDDRPLVAKANRAASADGTPYDLTHRIVRPDGTVRIVHDLGEVVRNETGTPVGIIGTIQDITERATAEAERNRLLSAIEQAADPIWTTDLDGTITYVNPSFARLYGYRADELLGQNPRVLKSHRHDPAFFADLWATIGSGRTWSGSFINRRRDGTLSEVESVISPIRNATGRLTGYIQTDRDVTRERELETALERNARERQTIEAALERIDPAGTLEEIAGAACAEILRLEGIDSAWVIGLGADHGRILAAAGRIGLVLAAGTPLPDTRARYLRERASGGPWAEAWRTQPEDGAYDELLSTTGLHTAVYAPLKSPHGVVGVIAFAAHDPANAERIIERLPALATFGAIVGALVSSGLETRHRDDTARGSVQAILDAGAFAPFFQPIVDLHDGAVVGFEALSRFADGTQPDIVFGLAAQSGLGIDLETATLAAAVAAAVVLPPEAYLSLNVSPELVHAGPLGPLLAGTTRPIVLEITEHVVIDDYAALRSELVALGPRFGLAVDDAGAGYASFRHILELAPATVKLDIGLIRGIDGDPARQALLAGMAYFAMKRKLGLVAEGIETVEELETLRRLAIHFGQGYLLGRPQDGRDPGPWPTKVAVGRG